MTVSTLAPKARRKRTRKPPPDPVTSYALDVVAGRVVTGELVRKAAERHLADLADSRGLRFDPKAAQRAIDFFPMLRHYKGDLGRPTKAFPQGHPIMLEPWQQFIVGSAFGWKREDGSRRFRQLYVEVAKKNGKTLMAAGIGMLLAFFDGEPGAEVYAGASKRDQAKLVWLDADMMVRKNPTLRKRLKRYALSLVDERTASSFKPLGKDSDTDQGINAHGAIIDELHIHKDRELIDNLETATSSRRQPMTVKITTAGTRGATVWEDERSDAVAVVEGRATDDSMLVLIYTLDEGDDPFDEAVWPKANPNLDVSVNAVTLREQSAAAQRSPGKLAPYLRFRMNVPTNVATRAISIDEWDMNDAEPDIPAGAIVYAGLDLASVQDLSALILVHRDAEGDHHVLCRFWCPEEGIEKRSRSDGVPYIDWVRDGYLIATPGSVTDYDFIREEVKTLATTYEIRELAYDKWNATSIVTQLEQDGATCVAISQTTAGMAPGWREVEKLLLEHHFRHGGHPVLRWMAGNVEVETDAAGNQKPSKARSSERIDGMVALTMSEARWMAHVDDGIPLVAFR
ncbi:MAG TPA: terminase TerL endonuclease subunit [Polyangia bacterium]|nr:terminase TerL endonuclease subunit [Polyangia bacterium]